MIQIRKMVSKRRLQLQVRENVNDLYLLLFNVVIFFLIFGGMIFNKHYCSDDYSMYYTHGYPWWLVIISSRIVLATVYWILDLLQINVVTQQVYIGVIFIVVLAWATTTITSLISKKLHMDNDWKNVLLLNLGTLFLFVNAFISEWIYFTSGYIQWIIAIIFTVLAVDYGTRSKKSFITILFLFCVAGSYQVMLIQYTIIAIFIAVFERRDKFFGELIRIGIMIAMSLVCNILISKGMVFVANKNTIESRINLNFSVIPEILEQYIKAQYRIWIEGLGTLPRWSMLLFFLFLVVWVLWRSKQNTIKVFLCGVLIVSVAELMFVSIQVIQGFCWLPMRVYIPIFALFSIAFWYLMYIFGDTKRKNGLNMVITVSIIFLGINIFNTQINIYDVIKMNTMDEESVQQLEQKIKKYEEESRVKVEKIGFSSDANMMVRYYSLLTNDTTSDIVRAFSRSWSDCNSVNFYTGRNLQRVEVPNEIATKFTSMDWVTLQLDEQIVFDNDTVYVIVY